MPESPHSPSLPIAMSRFWMILLTVAPPLTIAVMVYIWGVDVPFWDQWVLVPHLEQVAGGHWPWADLWRPHNEHRLFFPQLIMLALARLTAWNIRAELLINGLLALASLGGLYWLARQTLRSQPPWLIPIFSLIIFNPSQWENWIWGWQIQIFTNVLMVILGAALLARPERPWRFIAAAICGMIATYSFANGLLFWIVALPAAMGGREGRLTRLIAWLTVAAAVITFYFYGFEIAERQPFFEASIARTLKLFGGYLSIYLSAPLFGFHGLLALYGGFVVLTTSTLLLARRARKNLRGWLIGERSPWLLLAGYAVSSAVLTAIGRLHLSLGQALTSRYITISSLLWIALLALFAFRTKGSQELPTSARRTALAALAFALFINGIHGAGRMAETHKERIQARRALLDGPSDPDQLQALEVIYPDPELTHGWASSLERLSMGPFRNP